MDVIDRKSADSSEDKEATDRSNRMAEEEVNWDEMADAVQSDVICKYTICSH